MKKIKNSRKMKKIIKKTGSLCFLFFLGSTITFGQGQIHGNFQVDGQYYVPDSIIGAQEVSEKILSNAFANIIYTSENFTAGLRYESYVNPMLTFENYEGQGVPYKYAQYNKDGLDVTVGNFYEQFGNGLIFRSYEARNLGYDNAMEGVRLKFEPRKGVYLKGIVGKQRLYWGKGPGLIRGMDFEINLNELLDSLSESEFKITIGGSAISKYQKNDNTTLNLPENVTALSGRINISKKRFNLKSEYAYKINDPSSDNGLIFKPGKAFLVNSNYSKKGLGIMFEAKYLDNMSFRSDRYAGGNDVMINYLPAITRQHTYNLAATLYPYATQNNGELGMQGSVYKKFKKGTKLGGKYGTQVSFNYSQVRNLDTTLLHDVNTEPESKRLGYKTNIGVGNDKYFRDFNIEIKKKFSKKVKATFSYVSLLYNMEVVQGLGGKGIIKSNIGIVDITYKIKPKHTIRIEAQGLVTGDLLEIDMLSDRGFRLFEEDNRQDQGHWVTGLVEYTFSPHWSISVMDQYNAGNYSKKNRVHYLLGNIVYLHGANRYAVGFGRQRAGLLCVGGVCREVPAANGITLSVTSTF